MSDEQNKPSEGVDTSKYVPKDELDKVSSSLKEMQVKLEETNLKLLDPEYLEFLESKSGKRNANTIISNSAKVGDISADEMERLSKRELLNLAIERTKAAILNEVIPEYRDQVKRLAMTQEDILAVLELQNVEKRYTDFSDYRDDVRKLLESSKTPLTIEQAYKMAKFEKLNDQPAPQLSKTPPPPSEKPGSSPVAEDGAKRAFKTKDDASNDAWNKVVGSGKDYL